MNQLLFKLKIYGPKKFISYSLRELHARLWKQLFRKSFSQSWEDTIIDKLLANKKNGFYVDIGAYDPHRFSNTKKFYMQGWNGINIEPDVINFEKFVKERKRDINLNIGIGQKPQNIVFYKFIPDTLSTFSENEAKKYKKSGYKLIGAKKVPVKSLDSILSKYRKNKNIDFMSIDTEGYDLEVLKSNNWQKFRPKVVCIETYSHNKKEGKRKRNSEVMNFLENNGYKLYAHTGPNSIFVNKGYE